MALTEFEPIHVIHRQTETATTDDEGNTAAYGFHMTQTPISEEEMTPALGRTSNGMGVCQPQSVMENLRGEVRLGDVSTPVTTGGGKPGQGYPAVLVQEPLGIGIDGGETGYALRANPSHSGDKGDGGVNTTLVVAPEPLVYQCQGGTVGEMGTLRAGNGSMTSGIPFVAVQHVYGISNQPTPKIGEDVMPTLEAKETGGGRNEAVAYGISAQTEAKVAEQTQPTLTAKVDGTRDMVAYGIRLDTTPKAGEDIMPTLAANMGGGPTSAVAAPTNNDTDGPPMTVRRLLPVECARLQGFPDDHCLIPRRTKKDGTVELSADSSQYKAYGNSMATPVVSWIGRRIMMLDEE